MRQGLCGRISCRHGSRPERFFSIQSRRGGLETGMKGAGATALVILIFLMLMLPQLALWLPGAM